MIVQNVGRGIAAQGRRIRPSGYVAELLDWLRPKHLPVLIPDEHAGMQPIVSGALTVSHQPAVGDYSGSSILLAASSATASTVVVLPLPQQIQPFSQKYTRAAAGAVHVRIRCSNWAAVTQFSVGLGGDAECTKLHRVNLVDLGTSHYGCCNTEFASRWSGQWRTFAISSANFSAVGSPNPWGRDARYFNVASIQFRVACSAAVTFEVDRIYSPDWPAAAVSIIFDGWHDSIVDLMQREFIPRGWSAGGSRSRVDGDGYVSTAFRFRHITNAGLDVFPHNTWVKHDGTRVPMEQTTTAAEFERGYAEARIALLRAGASAEGMKFAQFLQNKGWYAGTDMGGILRKYGVDSCRRAISDAQWGVNPWVTATEAWSMNNMSTWVQSSGQMNWHAPAGFEGIALGAGYDAPRTDSYTMLERTEYAALSSNALMTYHHSYMDPTPEYSVSSAFMRAQVAHLAELDRAGKIVVVAPSVLMQMLHRRPGDVFLRWDGEWVYRHDPTKIAF